MTHYEIPQICLQWQTALVYVNTSSRDFQPGWNFMSVLVAEKNFIMFNEPQFLLPQTKIYYATD